MKPAHEPYRVALVSGDGIGPEVVGAAVEVLDEVAAKHGIGLRYERYEAGAGLYRRTGESISAADMEAIGKADAILLGACGLPEVRKPDGTEPAPQIDIREHYGLFGGLRPIRLHAGVPGPLRAARIDLLIIRENTEGLFAGRHDPFQPSDESILAAAGRAGLDVPYSCRSGVCATCRAKLLEGRVRMDRNFALEQADLDDGFVLTCQAHPLTERVVISFDER